MKWHHSRSDIGLDPNLMLYQSMGIARRLCEGCQDTSTEIDVS